MKLRSWKAIFAALMLPVIVAAVSIWSLSSQYSGSSKLPAAIVNLDEGAMLTIEGKQQFVPAGRLVVAELIHPSASEERAFDWQIMQQDKALAGLKDGSLKAVVTIPKDFSKNLSHLGTPQSQVAQVTVTTNGISDNLTTRLSQEITAAAARISGTTSTRQLLEGIFLNFGTLKKGFGDAASGAKQLHGGLEQLQKGTVDLNSGIGKLADGAHKLDDGSAQLSHGARQLANGIGKFRSGIDQIRGQINSLKLTAEQQKAIDQTLQLITRLENKKVDLHKVQDLLNNRELLDKIALLAKTCDAIDEMKPYCPQIKQLNAQLQAIDTKQLQKDLQQLQELQAEFAKIDKSQLREIAKHSHDLPQFLLKKIDGLGGQPGIYSGIVQLSDGANKLADGTDKLHGGISQLASGLDQLQDGAKALPEGVGKLKDGAGQLADGLSEGADKVPDYSQSQARHIAQVGADPIRSNSTQINVMQGKTTSVFPLVTALTLWLGAMAVFFVIPAISQRRTESPISSFRVVWSSLWRSAAICAVAAVSILLVAVAFGLRPEQPVATVSLLLAGAAIFSALLQALMSVFGAKTGRIIALGFLAIEAATISGVIPLNNAPAVFQAIGHVLPLSVVSNGLTQSLLIGESQSVLSSWAILLIWFGISLAASVAVVSRYRRMTASQLARLDQTDPEEEDDRLE